MNKTVNLLVISLLMASLLLYAPNIQRAVATGSHDVAIKNVTIDCSVTWNGAPSRINVTVVNNGIYSETVNVTIYANNKTIGEFDGIALASGTSKTINMQWDGRFQGSNSSQIGAYVISAFVHPVENETNTADNTFVAGTIKVTIPGDVNGDGKINILDLILVSSQMGRSFPPSGMTLPVPWRTDVNNDGKVDIVDLAMEALFMMLYNTPQTA